MPELGEEFDRIAGLVDDRLTASDYIQYYWHRIKCIFGHHHFHRGWLGGRVCLFCERIDIWDASQ